MIQVLERSIARPFLILAGIEFFLLVCCFYAGVILSWVEYPQDISLLRMYLQQALIFATILITAMFSLGLYEGLLTSSSARIVVRLAVAFCGGFAILAAIFYTIPEFSTWRAIVANALVLALFVIGVTHFLFLRSVNLNLLKRRVLVIGTGRLAARIQDLEKRGEAYGFTTSGFVETSDGRRPALEPNILSNSQPLIELVERTRADEIVVATEGQRMDIPMEQLVECGFRGVPVIDYSTFWERETKRTDLDALAENWILIAGGLPGSRFHHFVMRTFDIVLSFVALVFLLPVMVGTAIAIKLDSAGPIFYIQERVGLRGRPIYLIKFRSMRTDAESNGIPQWSSDKDPRVTTVGSFIRKTRIDELPQIINVLKGDMKFVGPRPERPFFVEQLAKEIPFYNQRFQVKPGITGWAQLNYPYAASTEDAREKLEYDLFYIKNYGLMLDLIIVLQTIRVILWPPDTAESSAQGERHAEASTTSEQ